MKHFPKKKKKEKEDKPEPEPGSEGSSLRRGLNYISGPKSRENGGNYCLMKARFIAVISGYGMLSFIVGFTIGWYIHSLMGR
jgi:hypothetical protein